MPSTLTQRILPALALLLALGVFVDEATAQRRRTRRSRRVTNPVTRPVAPAPAPVTPPSDAQIISTADQLDDQGTTPEMGSPVTTDPRRTDRKGAEVEDDADSMRRTVNELSSQVNKLTDKLSQMEQQQRTLVDMERLSRAEVRAEALRTQLRDVQEKEGAWQARIEQIDFSLKPESIDRSAATYGSTRPEEAREARRRQLESEKVRARTQIDLLAASRQRLETAVINADLEVDKLRRRIEEADEAQQRVDDGAREKTPTSSPIPLQPADETPVAGPPPNPPFQ